VILSNGVIAKKTFLDSQLHVIIILDVLQSGENNVGCPRFISRITKQPAKRTNGYQIKH
jgi:hypothetical protein